MSNTVSFPSLLTVICDAYERAVEVRTDAAMAAVFAPDMSDADPGIAQDEEPASQDDSFERTEA